jgi:transposase
VSIAWEVLIPHLSGLVVESVGAEESVTVLQCRVRAVAGACSACGQVSERVHGWYQRTVRDCAVAGTAVRLQIRVRRFRCVNTSCPAVTFVEQVAGLTAPHSRFTPLLRGQLIGIGLALAGRAGARLATLLGTAVGRDTLLRLVKSLPEPGSGPVRVLGVDDFAVRRGRRYGTILMDLDSGRVLDLLEGRDSDTLAGWLREHPGVEVICRDRAGSYADGARTGAPAAIQVADRFHLWQNLMQAVEKTVNAHRAHLVLDNLPPPGQDRPLRQGDGPGRLVNAGATLVTDGAAPAVAQPVVEKRIIARWREQHAAVHRLRRQGLSKAAIGRQVGLHPATVRKLLGSSLEELTAKTEQRAHLVDQWIPHLHQRWNEGERNATNLFREIQQLGYPGGELAVQRYLRRFRDGRGHARIPPSKPVPIRKVTAWIMTHPDHLTAADRAVLTQITDGAEALDRLAGHVRDFAVMITTREGIGIDAWITQVETDTLPALTAFAQHLRHDLTAVRNGLTLTHSSGAVEGTINRLKMLKRQMFGRASLHLLRQRMIHQT